MSPTRPVDRNGKLVSVGDLVRVISLSGKWFDELPAEDRERVESMVGEVFAIGGIDEYGHPWVCKWWQTEKAETAQSHCVALDPSEMEFVSVPTKPVA